MAFPPHSARNSMEITTQAVPLEAQSTGVLLGHRDLNHSRFPGGIEAQPTKQPFVSKKARWIAASIVLLVALIVTAVFVGGKFGMSMAKNSVIQSVYTTASAAFQTVYVTTTVSSTLLVLVSVTSKPTTITTTSTKTLAMPTPLVMSAPMPTPTLEMPKRNPPKPDSLTNPHGPEQDGCNTIGNRLRQDECEAGCSNVTPKMGQTTYCRVDPARVGTRAVWACIICQKKIRLFDIYHVNEYA
jgi:hypothetical protein